MENTNTTSTSTKTDTNDSITTIGNVVVSIFIIIGLLLAVRFVGTEFPSYERFVIPVGAVIFYSLFGDPKFLRKKKITKDAQNDSNITPPQNSAQKEH